MNNESLEDKYFKVLRQRISLEGDLALMRQNATELVQSSSVKAKRYLLLLFLTPLCLLFFRNRQVKITAVQNQLSQQTDSVSLLKERILILENTQCKRIRYITQSTDNLAILGELFYNDSLAGKQIDLDNHLHMPSLQTKMFAGDTIYLKYR